LLARYFRDFPSVSGFILENSIGKPLNTSQMAAHGYNWKTLYAGRHGAVTEVGRHTGGNTQIGAGIFGHSPETEAKHYIHGILEEERRPMLALQSALFPPRDKRETAHAATTASDR
jgi:hypothetical protein